LTKVIFLDIDGPMIPGTWLLVDNLASWKREFPPHTVAVVREMCKRTGALVVFNTTHNRPFAKAYGVDDIDDIDVALVKQGLPEEYLHPTDHATQYPDIERGLAVTEWLHRHTEVTDWVALDDVKFTDDKRLLLVDPMVGLTVDHLNDAIDLLGGGPKIWIGI